MHTGLLSAVEVAYLTSVSDAERAGYIRQRAALEIAYRDLFAAVSERIKAEPISDGSDA